jgi:hypothetical protein
VSNYGGNFPPLNGQISCGKSENMIKLPILRFSRKMSLIFASALLLMSLHHTHLYGNEISLPGDTCTTRTTFAESLAEHVQGRVLEHDRESVDNGRTWSSVIWIPTYYGYHTFLGVLDSFIAGHTALTSLRTWRLADRNFYVILLSQKNVSVRIVYDSRNSLLMLTAPAGF